MPDDEQEELRKKLSKELLDRWKKGGDEAEKKEKPPVGGAPEPTPPAPKEGKKARSTLDDLDAFMAGLASGRGEDEAKPPTEIEQLYRELEEEDRDDPRQRRDEIKGRLADIERAEARAGLKGAPKKVEEEEEEPIEFG